MQHYFYTFRVFWLFCLGLVLANTVGIALTTSPDPTFNVRAEIWVEYSVYYNYQDVKKIEIVEPTVDNHSKLLQSLLESRTFQDSVLEKTERAGFKLNGTLRDTLRARMEGYIVLKPVGNNLLYVEHTGNAAEFNVAFVQAIIESYEQFVENLVVERGKLTIEYLDRLLTEAKADNERNSQKLTEFLATLPGRGLYDNSQFRLFLNEDDVTLDLLTELRNQSSQRYDKLNTELEHYRMGYSALLAGEAPVARFESAPHVVESAVFDRTTRLALGGGLGFIGGLVLALLAVLVLTWQDGSFQNGRALGAYLKVPYLGDLDWTGPSPARSFGKRKFRRSAILLNFAWRWRRKRVVGGLVVLALLALTVFLSSRYPANAVVVPVFALVVGMVYRWPGFGFYLSIAIVLVCEVFALPDGFTSFTVLPLTNIRSFTTLPVSATLLEVLIALTVLLAALKALRRGEPLFERSFTSLAMAGFSFFIVVGYAFGIAIQKGNNKAALWEVRALIYIVVFYFLTIYFSRNRNIWKVLNWMLPIGLSILSIFGVWRVFALAEYSQTGLLAESLNGLNHDDAILFVIMVMWCTGQAVFAKSRLTRYAGWLLMLLPFTAILVSGRRAAFASLAMCGLLYLAVLFTRRRRTFYIVLAVLMVVVPLYLTLFKNVPGPLGLPARAFSSGSSETNQRDLSSDLYRVIEKSNVQLTIKASPWLGIGFGREFTRYSDIVNLEAFTFQYYTPHVQVLWLWLKVGVFGWMLFWIVICEAMFRVGQFIKYETDSLRNKIALTFGSAIVAEIIFAYIDLSLINTRLMLLLGVSLGLLERGYRELQRPAPPVVPAKTQAEPAALSLAGSR